MEFDIEKSMEHAKKASAYVKAQSRIYKDIMLDGKESPYSVITRLQAERDRLADENERLRVRLQHVLEWFDNNYWYSTHTDKTTKLYKVYQEAKQALEVSDGN